MVTSAQSNLTNGRIAHADIPYTLQWAAPPPQLPLPMGDVDPIKYMVPWSHLSPQPKQHIVQFRHFFRAHNRDRQTTLLGQ